MFWTVDERLDVERQVMRAISYDIARGGLLSGGAMPLPRALAETRILNPSVVESAYGRLAEAGLLLAVSGGGYRVPDDAQRLARDYLVEWAEEEVRNLVGSLRRAGLSGEEIHRILQEVRDA